MFTEAMNWLIENFTIVLFAVGWLGALGFSLSPLASLRNRKAAIARLGDRKGDVAPDQDAGSGRFPHLASK